MVGVLRFAIIIVRMVVVWLSKNTRIAQVFGNCVVFFSHVQKKAEARDLYEQVFYSLDLIEKDYFGLQFTDVNHVKHWLDPTKAIKKQIKSKCG